MTATIAAEPWLDFLVAEYLHSFISDGGASVKFVVPLDETLREAVQVEIDVRSREAGYVVARVSSGDTRVQMVEQLFFKVAEQIQWASLCQDVIVKLAREAGYPTDPDLSHEPLFHRLAVANNVDPDVLRMEARNWISSRVFRLPLARDLRVAMTQLCLAELSGGLDGETAVEVISDWLTGRNRAVSAVKPYQIFSRINRSNARHLLESLLIWLRFAGHPGIVVIMDTARLTMVRNPRDEWLFYTKAAMLDAYELLRQFIDATDRMSGLLLVVIPSADFLDPEAEARGMGAYDALKTRVYDEVRDERLVNPMGALVRVSRNGGPQ